MDGPTLQQYVETRLNLITEAMKAEALSQHAAVTALKASIEATLLASDLRYQQRFDSQSNALSAAFASQQTAMSTALVTAEKAVLVAQAAADRAVSKAELAADKRFESVNEFRKTLDDQQRTLMPRPEVNVMFGALSDKYAALKEQMEGLLSERGGAAKGWGYAVGVVGLLLALGSLLLIGIRFLRGA
jgi:hypothetical protein